MNRRIYLFGGLQIRAAHDSRRLVGEKVRSLLAYLLLHPHRPVPREMLADLLFPNAAPERVRRNLSATLSRLKAALGSGWLKIQRDSLALEVSADLWVDVWEFERLAASDLTYQLQKAADLYTGDLLPEVYDDWIVPERELLRNQYLAVLEKLAQLYEQDGELQPALLTMRRLVLAEPLHEPAHLTYLRLLGRLQRYGEAIAHYEYLRKLLQEELGTEPMAETRQVVEALESERALATAQVVREEKIEFVGRVRERMAALEAVELAFRGSGGILAIEGEAGIGKSRFLREVAAGAHWRGATVIQGQASETPEASPFAPLAAALAPIFNSPRMEQLEILLGAETLAALAPLRPAWSAKATLYELPPELARNRFLNALKTLGEALAHLTPFVVALDDLHWADPALWSSLDVLAQSIARRGGLMIVVYRRPEIENTAGWEVIQTWDRNGLLKSISLGPFSVDEVAQLIEKSTDADPAEIHALTGGNPFYIQEWLAEPRMNWPANHNAISIRLQTMTSPTKSALESAAILGENIPYRLWFEISEMPPLMLAGLCDELMMHRWLRPSIEGFTFEHDLIRAKVYEEVDLERRRRLHERAAQAYSTLEPDNLRGRAHHLDQAGLSAEAAKVYRLAGQQDRARFAFNEAQRSMERALSCMPRKPTLEWVETNLELVELCDITGDLKRLQSALDEALAGARQLRDADLQFRTNLAAGRAADDTGEMEKAETHIRGALSIAREMQDHQREVVALYWLSVLTAHQGKLHDASAIAVEALARARDIRDQVSEGKLLRAIGIQKSELEEPAEAIQWLEKSVQVLGALGDSYNMWLSQLILSSLYSELGMWDRNLETAEELIRHFEASGAQVKADNARLNLIDLHFATSNLPAARQIIQDIPDGGMAFGIRGVAIVKFNLGLIEEGEANYTNAERYYLEAIEIAEAAKALDLVADAQHNLGSLLLRLGSPPKAIPLLASAHAFRLEEGYLLERLQTEAFLGLALLASDEHARAKEIAMMGWKAFKDGVPRGLLFQDWLWALYRLMIGMNQTTQADEVLRAAYEELQRQAKNIRDPHLRRSFFERVPVNRSIVAAYDEHTATRRVISVRLALADAPLGRTLEADEFVTVKWTVNAPEDEAFSKKDDRRRHRLIRLLQEAQRQGGAPTDDDLASALGVSRRTILRDLHGLADELPISATRKRKKRRSSSPGKA